MPVSGTEGPTERHRQRSIRWAGAGLLVIISLAGLMVFVLHPNDPVYEGKRASQWLDDLDSHQPFAVQEKAKKAIKELRAKAMPMIVDYLRSSDSKLNSLVAEEFEGTPPSAYEERALTAIELLGPTAASALPEVEHALIEGGHESHAAAALLAIGPEAVEVLHRALQCTNSDVRQVAAWSIGDFGKPGEVCIPNLLKCLRGPDSDMRANAAHSLGMMHEEAKLVVPALAANLGETNRRAFINVFDALARFGSEARDAVPALERETRKGEPMHRALAAVTLRSIDLQAAKKAGLATPQMLKTLRGTDADSRAMAAMLLFWLDRESELEVADILPALSDTNATIRNLALVKLGRCTHVTKESLPAVAACLDDSNEGVRLQATGIVCRIDPDFFSNRTN